MFPIGVERAAAIPTMPLIRISGLCGCLIHANTIEMKPLMAVLARKHVLVGLLVAEAAVALSLSPNGVGMKQ